MKYFEYQNQIRCVKKRKFVREREREREKERERKKDF